ncbi:hypothetical protein GQ600_4227 [Phytophthora cactorum]|nr:hypothetical protein GQ600_4227 [Phytophthora cactorum]
MRAKINKVSNKIAMYNTAANGAMTVAEVRILVTRRLLSAGLPHTLPNNAELLRLFRRLSNQDQLELLARDTFYYFADGEFHLIKQCVMLTLRTEFDAFLHIPFARCSMTCGLMRQTSISLEPLYQIDIDKFARFTVSDTTGSARNVCEHFSATEQVVWFMYLLSLCILYALGLKENTRAGGQIVVTPGSEFPHGLRVLQKLRDLAVFFGKPLRLVKLKQIKEMSNLPAVNIEVDAKKSRIYSDTNASQCVQPLRAHPIL